MPAKKATSKSTAKAATKQSSKAAAKKTAASKPAKPAASRPAKPATLTLKPLRPAASQAPIAVPSRHAAFAAGTSVWADAKRVVRIARDGAATPLPIKPPKGAEIADVTLSDDGARLGVLLTKPGENAQLLILEPDGTTTTHESTVAIGFASNGDLHLARPKEIVHAPRDGATQSPARPTGGYITKQVRSDGAACFGEYGQLRVLLADGTSITFKTGEGPVESARMHPTLPLIAGQWREEGKLRVFDWTDGRLLLEHAAPWCRGVLSFAFSPDGEHLAAIGPGAHVFALTTGTPTLSLPGGRDMTGGFIDDDTLQISAGVLSNHPLAAPASQTDLIFSLSLSPDGQRIALERGGRVELWSITGDKLADLDLTGVDRLAFLDDTLLAATTSSATFILDTAGTVRHRITHDTTAELAVGNTSLTLFTTTLQHVDLTSGTTTPLSPDLHDLTALARTGDRITACRAGATILVLDATTGATTHEMPLPTDAAPPTSTHLVGDWLLAATDSQLFGARLDQPQPRARLLHRDLAGPVVSSPDARRLLVLRTNEAHILDESLTPLARFTADDITAAAFDAHATRLVLTRHGQLEHLEFP